MRLLCNGNINGNKDITFKTNTSQVKTELNWVMSGPFTNIPV